MKYKEDEILQEVFQYIQGTYGEHYAGDDEVQLVDLWHSQGTLSTIAIGTAQKYLTRFGKKEGLNKKDLLKAIHYIVLAMWDEFGQDEVTEDTDDSKPDNDNDAIKVTKVEELLAEIAKGGGIAYQLPMGQ